MNLSGNFITLLSIIMTTLQLIPKVTAQDYEVSDINCSFGDVSVETNSRINQIMSAVLKKPEKFQGSPIFADDRSVNPLTDSVCQIRPTNEDKETYRLLITDLDECGILVKNGFINVRVWFPKLPGVVMMSDQEVIIMCKPPERVVTQNKAAGFAGALPPAARVSGVVQESPGTLEYEVALYREASPRSEDGGNGLTVDLANEIPVDQAVPIGTKLQLRATINDESAWKFVKLQEVTISTSNKNAYSPGHITIVENGCRKEKFSSIVPRQPYRPELKPNEVRLEFEAVLLDINEDQKNQLWIHAKIKACVSKKDCNAEFCLDLYQPSGMGRRRKRSKRSNENTPEGQVQYFYRASPSMKQRRNNSRILDDRTSNINDNVGVTVVMPKDEYYTGTPDGTTTTHRSVHKVSSPTPSLDSTIEQKLLLANNGIEDCQIFIVVGSILGCLLIAASLLMCLLSVRLFKLTKRYKKEKLECVVREHRLKFGNHPVPTRNERSTDLFSTSGNSNFMPQRMATAET